MKRILYSLFLSAILLAVLPMTAEIVRDGDEWRVYDEQYSDEIEFEYRHVLIPHNSIGLNNGDWWPGCGGLMPLSILFNAEYGAEMGVKMKGRARAQWSMSIGFHPLWSEEDGSDK